MADSATDRFFRYLNWLFNPLHGLKTTEVYDLIGTSSLTENALYLNLGYWRQANTIDEASEALAMLVAERGGMGPGDTVLDCGYGFGDQQDFLPHSWPYRLDSTGSTGKYLKGSLWTMSDPFRN